MKRIAPPAWMERVLEFLLSSRDRAAVAGDLHEEYCESKVSQLGRLRADLWYLRQVVSFAPIRFRTALSHPRALALLCVFTALCGIWLGAMDLLLQHPASQLVIASVIVCQAILTLASLRFVHHAFFRYAATLGCVALFWLAFMALRGAVQGTDVEGYVLVIGVALLMQGILTLGTLPRTKRLA